jgi:hypothetical protein
LVYCLSVLMKTTYTIAAIAMFAVILGMSALAPAMASKPSDYEDGKHKIEFCHYQAEKTTDKYGNELETPIPEAYLVIETDKKGQMKGHFKNGDAHHFGFCGKRYCSIRIGSNGINCALNELQHQQ